jgi:hypothetical protein
MPGAPAGHRSTQGVISPQTYPVLVRERRRVRTTRFIVCEALAIGLLLGSMLAAFSTNFATGHPRPFLKMLPILAAAIATLIPVLFFGNPKRRNRGRRAR